MDLHVESFAVTRAIAPRARRLGGRMIVPVLHPSQPPELPFPSLPSGASNPGLKRAWRQGLASPYYALATNQQPTPTQTAQHRGRLLLSARIAYELGPQIGP